jgi:hypothetical protein
MQLGAVRSGKLPSTPRGPMSEEREVAGCDDCADEIWHGRSGADVSIDPDDSILPPLRHDGNS